MTTSVLSSNGISSGLRRYAESLSAPRRQRQRVLGPDVDPDHCLTDFLFCIGTGVASRLNKVYRAERTKTAMGQGAGISGGYLVPEELRLDLMEDVAEDALVRPRATIVPMTSSLMRLPLPDAGTAQSAGVAPYFGGIQMSWTSEGTTRPETEPAFREVDLRAWDLTGYCLQSNPLYQDGGPGLESFLRKLFARSIAFYEDYAYLRGDGVGKPKGIVNAEGAITVTRETASQFTIQDVWKMSRALLPQSWSRSIWVISPLVWEFLTSMETSAWQLKLLLPKTDQAHFFLNGQRGFVSGSLPPLGTKGDVILFDPQLYVIGDRGAVEVDVSFDVAFTKGQAVWRVTYRGDGQPWFGKSITLADGSTLTSPYAVLGP